MWCGTWLQAWQTTKSWRIDMLALTVDVLLTVAQMSHMYYSHLTYVVTFDAFECWRDLVWHKWSMSPVYKLDSRLRLIIGLVDLIFSIFTIIGIVLFSTIVCLLLYKMYQFYTAGISGELCLWFEQLLILLTALFTTKVGSLLYFYISNILLISLDVYFFCE